MFFKANLHFFYILFAEPYLCRQLTIDIPLPIFNLISATHEMYMRRCLQIAEMGAGSVAPNPMVGSVLVHEGRIIGEGFHQQYGQAHAEVNCINSVLHEDVHLIPESTIYVSLEPCAHFGKTPPCADLIIHKNIKKVIVGCRDPFKEVDGKGIEKMRLAGIEVTVGVLEKECEQLNKRFFTFHNKKRPYIILKWAQTADGYIAADENSRTFISNDYSNKLVHKWRSEEAAILVGTNTALLDNPSLTTRHWKGANPTRIVLDKNLRLPTSLQVFDGSVKTIVFNRLKQEQHPNLLYQQLGEEQAWMESLMSHLYKLSINSVLVEGGAKTLQSFIDAGFWDEARIVTNNSLWLYSGTASPKLKEAALVKRENYLDDTIAYFVNTN